MSKNKKQATRDQRQKAVLTTLRIAVELKNLKTRLDRMNVEENAPWEKMKNEVSQALTSMSLATIHSVKITLKRD